jgi:hypothetical protein
MAHRAQFQKRQLFSLTLTKLERAALLITLGRQADVESAHNTVSDCRPYWDYRCNSARCASFLLLFIDGTGGCCPVAFRFASLT